MNAKEAYELWLQKLDDQDPLKAELLAIAGDENEIEDRFYQELSFGTAGLRGKVGAGTNRMNVITVGRATQGVADYIKEAGAEAMERGGKDARSIKLATGWERGKDGKWRHEERDLRLNDEQFMKFVQHDGSAIYWGKLGDLVGDNELFDAYPQLKELTIYSNTDNDNQYDPKHNEIGLATNVVWSDAMQRDYNKLAELRESLEYNLSRAEAVKDRHPHAAENYRIWASDDQHAIAAIQENIDWMRDVLNAALVHEVQHAIQEIEGFARGGSPRDFGGTPDEMVVGQAIADRMAADRVIEDGDTIDTLREKFNERKDKEDFDTKNERRVIADAIGIMSEGYTPKDVRDLYAKEEKRLWDMYHDDSPESAYGKYNRLAGEVEARNVSKRMKMTDEQRRQSLAEDTEDVARDEQIVRYGGGVSAMSPVINATSRIRKGELDEIAREISSDRSGNVEDKLVVQLTKATQDERDMLKTAISKESNGTYEDLTARAAAIRDMDAIAIQPEAVSRDEFGRILKSNGNLVTIADDGMNVSFSERAMNKLYNKMTSASGIAKEIIHLLGSAKYAYSQPHNNTGEKRDNGSTHPDRQNALEYRNYVTKVAIDGDNYYCRFTVMRDVAGDNMSHGAVVSEVKLSKENTTGKDADGVKQSHELTSAIPNKTRWSSGFTLRDDAKLNTFFELAKTGEQKSDDKTLIIPLKGGETTNFRVRDGHEAAVEEARRRLESDDASEFERQAARAVIKAYGGGDAPDTPGGGVRFRIRDDADMLVDTAKLRNEVARQRRDAVTDFVKAITDVDELTDSKFATALGKVMRGQRTYDQATVADITTMVKAMMDAGLLTELDNFSVKQILTKLKDSTGKNDITAEANKLIDIMLKHQLRRGKRAFEQQLKVKGMRQDSRGVVVQNNKDY